MQLSWSTKLSGATFELSKLKYMSTVCAKAIDDRLRHATRVKRRRDECMVGQKTTMQISVGQTGFVAFRTSMGLCKCLGLAVMSITPIDLGMQFGDREERE